MHSAAARATLHHAGDVDFSDHAMFDDIGKRFAIDATLLPIGGMMPVWYYRARRHLLDRGIHIDPDCALDIYERLGARALVPVHWGTLHLRFGLPRAARAGSPRSPRAQAVRERPHPRSRRVARARSDSSRDSNHAVKAQRADDADHARSRSPSA